MPAALQDIRKADQIGLHVVVRMVNAVPDAGLCSEINDAVEAVVCKTGFHLSSVRKVRPDEAEAAVRLASRLLQKSEACFLKGRIVIGIDAVETNHLIATKK